MPFSHLRWVRKASHSTLNLLLMLLGELKLCLPTCVKCACCSPIYTISEVESFINTHVCIRTWNCCLDLRTCTDIQIQLYTPLFNKCVDLRSVVLICSGSVEIYANLELLTRYMMTNLIYVIFTVAVFLWFCWFGH